MRNPTAMRTGSICKYIHFHHATASYRATLRRCEYTDAIKAVDRIAHNPCSIRSVIAGLAEVGASEDEKEIESFVRQLVSEGYVLVIDGRSSKGRTSARSFLAKVASRAENPVGREAVAIAGVLAGETVYDGRGEQVSTAVISVAPCETCTIAKSDLRYLNDAVAILQRLCPSAKVDTFGDFKAAFVHRYKSGFQPMLKVLDEVSGIGFPPWSTNAGEEKVGVVTEPQNEAYWHSRNMMIDIPVTSGLGEFLDGNA